MARTFESKEKRLRILDFGLDIHIVLVTVASMVTDVITRDSKFDTFT